MLYFFFAFVNYIYGCGLEKRTCSLVFFMKYSSHIRCPPSGATNWQNIAVTRVSHSCLEIDLGPICDSIAASLCFKSCEDHSLLKCYNGGLWKTVTGLGTLTRLSIRLDNKRKITLTVNTLKLHRATSLQSLEL